MEQNPYNPPKASVDGAHITKGSGVKAVVIGLLVDIGGTTVFGIIVSLIWGFVLASGGMDDKEIQVYFDTSTTFLLASLVYGSAFTGFGGYIAAKIANHQEYKYAFLVGLFSLIIGEIFIAFMDNYPIWHRIAGDLIIIPVAVYGGHLRVVAKRKMKI